METKPNWHYKAEPEVLDEESLAALPDHSGPIKLESELDDLKRQWLEDDNWDIEDTEGFEAYREELHIFSLQQKLAWAEERLAEAEAPSHAEARVIAFTDLNVGKRRISVTAREGATDVMVTDTVRSLLEGANTIYKAYEERAAERAVSSKVSAPSSDPF